LEIATNEGEDKKTFQTLKVQRFAMLFGFIGFQEEGPISLVEILPY